MSICYFNKTASCTDDKKKSMTLVDANWLGKSPCWLTEMVDKIDHCKQLSTTDSNTLLRLVVQI